MTPLDNITLRHQLEIANADCATFQTTIAERRKHIEEARAQINRAELDLLKVQGMFEYAVSTQQRLTEQVKASEDASRAPAATQP